MEYSSYLYSIGYNDPLPSGVYALMNVLTGRLYVGSTQDLTHRSGQHFKLLEEGLHPNRELQNDFTSYGPQTYSFIVLERASDPTQLEQMEQRWLDRLRKHTPVFNRDLTVERPEPETIHPLDKTGFPWETLS